MRFIRQHETLIQPSPPPTMQMSTGPTIQETENKSQNGCLHSPNALKDNEEQEKHHRKL